MDSWSTLTDDEVLKQFNDSETDAYNTAKGDDTGESLADIIVKVTDQIRLAYDDASRVVDSEPGTIPDGEKNRAIAIVRWKFLLALPAGKSLQTDERKKANDDAEAYFLNDVAKQGIKQQAVEVSTHSHRKFTRHKMDGL